MYVDVVPLPTVMANVAPEEAAAKLVAIDVPDSATFTTLLSAISPKASSYVVVILPLVSTPKVTPTGAQSLICGI